MAQLNLIQIIRAATAELGLVQPLIAIGAQDLQDLQFVALVNRAGDELKRAHDWTVLQSLFTLNVTPPTITTGNLTTGSPIITGIPSTAGITAGIYTISGNNIPVAARVLTVDNINQITMDMVATGPAVASQLTFAQDTYPEPSDFDRFL